jgi:hypothetical protein
MAMEGHNVVDELFIESCAFPLVYEGIFSWVL